MSERICPHCQQPIFDEEALLCHFCGESLRKTSSGFLGQVSATKWIVAAVLLLSFLILMIK